jgi:drug/metabolite transporter (DMT)-like permease
MTSTGVRHSYPATLLGLAALLMWGSLAAVARGVRDEMGTVPAAAAANLVGGLIGLAWTLTAGGRAGLRAWRCLPAGRAAICGALFIAYNLALYTAIQRAATHVETVHVVLLNYLWPALMLALMVPILKRRAGPALWPGLLLATVGACWAASQGTASQGGAPVHDQLQADATQGKEHRRDAGAPQNQEHRRDAGATQWSAAGAHLRANPLPYLLALAAALSWAVYSNLSRLWLSNARINAVPLFLAATGLALALMHIAGRGAWRLPDTPRQAAQLAYFTLGPTLLAYVFWDIAMRRGDIVLVNIVSFFMPVLSTVISGIWLGVPLTADLWAASGLIVLGAIGCRRAVQ